MLVGLDFDNTIVCYDGLFHRLAVERGLIPASLPATKQSVRDHLRAAGREDDWTELQGIAYGPRITDAVPFPGVTDCLRTLRKAGVGVAVVSHKTRHPYRGVRHDLHAAAHGFLRAHGFYKADVTGLSPDRVFLELTLSAKLARVAALGCDAFVDDLPELLSEPAFPAGVRKILFDPAGAHRDEGADARVRSWAEVGEAILAEGRVPA
jgi:FMN phosphatase YigB (HAD superfamily)